MKGKILLAALLAALCLSGCGKNVHISESNIQSNTDAEQTLRGPSEGADLETSESSNAGTQQITSKQDDGETIVGISLPSQVLLRWNKDGHFLQKHFEKAGCKVILSYANDLIDSQMDQIESMISANVDLLIITPIDASSLSKQLEKAKEKGIPVIAYDRLILDSPYLDYYVSYDNYQVGALQGEYIKNALNLEADDNESYNIEIISGDVADNNAYFYYNGAMDVLKPYLQSKKLNIRSNQTSFFETSVSSWSTDLAQERFEGILNSYYSKKNPLHAVCCANDSTALGVTRAITNNRDINGDIIITGQDGDADNLKNIMEDKQSMTVYKLVRNESKVTLALGLQILKSEKPNQDLIENANWNFECIYDTTSYDNGEKVVSAYLLEPFVVTKENMQETLIDTGYYTPDEK